MIVPFEINNKVYEIKAYDTFKEKELLLLGSFGVFDFERIFDILEFKDYSDLSDDEKKVILYKHREISIGDEIDVKFKCEKCGQGNESILEATNFITPSKRNDSDIKKILKPFNEENMHEYVDIDVDELDICDYETLKQRIIDNQQEINFVKQAKCLKCQHNQKFNIGNLKYIVDIMSEDSLMTLYKAYNYLIFFGKYSKNDIDRMYPFERSIFIGLLNKTKEDLNK